MKNVFDIPQSLREAIDKVASIDRDRMTVNTSWRRDLDIRPLVMIAGLSKTRHINEVYDGKASDFATDEIEAQKNHDLLTVTKPKDFDVAQSVLYYSRSGYRKINSHLWNSYVHDAEVPNDIKTHVENIKTMLIPKTAVDNLNLYTGVKVSPASTSGIEWNSTRSIKLLHLPALTSTSTNFDVASQFTEHDNESTHHESDHHGIIQSGAKHILQLHFPNEIHHAVSMIDHSASPHEEEVLLGPNHSFELHPRPTKVDGPRGPVYVWKAVSRGVDNSPMFRQRDFTKSS